MTITLDTLAVPANYALSAKYRVELIFPSPSLEKKEVKSVSTLTYAHNGVMLQVYRRFGLGVYYRPFLYRRVRRQGS